MLFWAFVIAFIVGFAMFIIGFDRDCEIVEMIGCVLWVFSFIAGVVCAFIIMFNHSGVDGEVAAMNARYDSLMFQYYNDIYENDNDLGKRDLYEEIQKWNENLARNQENQDDLWIGIFIPDIYDQFEFIELEVSYG